MLNESKFSMPWVRCAFGNVSRPILRTNFFESAIEILYERKSFQSVTCISLGKDISTARTLRVSVIWIWLVKNMTMWAVLDSLKRQHNRWIVSLYFTICRDWYRYSKKKWKKLPIPRSLETRCHTLSDYAARVCQPCLLILLIKGQKGHIRLGRLE